MKRLECQLCPALFGYRSKLTAHIKTVHEKGKRWDVRLDFVRQFKTDYVRQLEGLVFEKKS